MNTSLFVGLCEDAGLHVYFSGGIAYIYNDLDERLADVSEFRRGDYFIDLWGAPERHIKVISEIVPKYAITPIEERE